MLGEIKNHLHHVKSWSKKRYIKTPLKLFPSCTYQVQEPLGNSLIIAPWNYPVQLLLNPLVGAISAGCTAILKPSPYVENVSTVLEKMIKEIKPNNRIYINFIGPIIGTHSGQGTLALFYKGKTREN